MKFTGELGHVEVSLVISSTTGDEMTLEFCVSDTGIGITESFKKKLFEPFCQFFNYSRGGGTGLGLAISQNLVRLMQGKISFTIYFSSSHSPFSL